MNKIILFMAFYITISFPTVMNAAGENNCETLQKIFDTEVEFENGVCAVEIVREELEVTHMGKKLSPKMMELVFHFAFENIDNQTAVMGELALLEDEVNPVIEELRKGNIEVSALHNHMISERPRILYVHFQGLGDLAQQAKTIKKAIEKTSN